MRNLALVIGLLGAAGAEATACSSHFDSCVDSRTCPSASDDGGSSGDSGTDTAHSGASASAGSGATADAGGNGGEAAAVGDSAGEGGASGAAPAVACSKDSECSDGLACNGSETCKDGFCANGTPPCANPDPTHCEAVCTEVAGAASCAVQGRDADHDEHLSNACAAKPGDDCDDADATIHPGATEICDGVDHNCNGKLGIADGLPAGGSNVAIGPSGATSSLPAIAWATDKSAYGISYRDTTSSSAADLYLEEVDQGGAIKMMPAALNNAATKVAGTLADAALAWGGDSFGAVWSAAKTGAVGGTAVCFEQIGSGGSPGAIVNVPSKYYPSSASYDLAIARIASGNWAVLFEAETEAAQFIQGNTISATGTVDNFLDLGSWSGDAVSWSIAASGTDFVIGATLPAASSAGLWTSALVSAKPLTLSGKYPKVGSGPNGFAIAAQTSSGPQFSSFLASGTVVCDAVSIADSAFKPAGVVATQKGYLIVSSGMIRAQEVHTDCTLGPLFTIDAGPTDDTVRVAAGAAGYGVVWQDTSAGVPKRRFFGPNFCD